MAYRLVLADDHGLLRAGLRRLLERNLHDVVGEANDGAATLGEVARTAPEIVLLDLRMPSTDPCAVIATIRRDHAAVRVVVVTGACTPELCDQVLAAGASAVVLKTSGIGTLTEALAEAMAGRVFVDPLVRDAVLGGRDPLTARERTVLSFLARGVSYADAGRQLRLSERTVESYRWHIAKKLGLRSREELVRYALDHGLLALEPGGSG